MYIKSLKFLKKRHRTNVQRISVDATTTVIQHDVGRRCGRCTLATGAQLVQKATKRRNTCTQTTSSTLTTTSASSTCVPVPGPNMSMGTSSCAGKRKLDLRTKHATGWSGTPATRENHDEHSPFSRRPVLVLCCTCMMMRDRGEIKRMSQNMGFKRQFVWRRTTTHVTWRRVPWTDGELDNE